MSENIKTGMRGEDLASDFLRCKGFEILSRNYRFRKAEIDIIARKDDWLIFVEVKTRSHAYFGHPEEFVDRSQASRILQAAEEFIFKTNWHGHIRFDIISVMRGDDFHAEPEIIHFEDAIN